MSKAIGEADFGERRRGALARLGRRDALEHRGHHRVLEGGEITEEVVELEYEADVLTAVSREGGLAPAEPMAALKQHATRRWPIERAEDVQQRGLADARGADERHDFTGADLDRGAAQDSHRLGPSAVLALQVDASQQRVTHI